MLLDSRKAAFSFVLLLFALLCSNQTDAAFSASGTAFVHMATAANTSGHITTIDHPTLNGNPDAKLLVTQHRNPSGVGGGYNNHVIGVYYSNGFWRIFNQDLATMPIGAAFNVFLANDTATTFIHTHTSSNDGYNETWIDHPQTNNQPDKLVFTTKNWNPNGGSGVYNSFPTQVGYSTTRNEWGIVKEQADEFAPMPTDAAFNVLVTDQDALTFVHIATSSNTSTSQTVLDHPALNNNPDAIFFVEARWNFANYFGATRENLGVYYDGTNWTIFNQGLEAMVDSAEFNILIPQSGLPISGTAFVHTATVDNIDDSATTIDHPALNGNPGAKLLVTQNWNPGGTGGRYNDKVIGVYYFGGFWRIFNQDNSAMPVGAAFNVLLADANATTFVHTHTSSNDGYNETWIDHPQTNNLPANLVFTTKNWNPIGAPGVYNNFTTQVGYSTTRNEWGIVKEQSDEFTPMPTDAAFNVLVTSQNANSFVHRATSSNILSNSTQLDHPALNDNPDAIFFIEARWNFSNYFGATRENLGVWYNGSRWLIFNQGIETMVDSAEFNILIPTTAGVPTSVGLGQMAAGHTSSTAPILLTMFLVLAATSIMGRHLRLPMHRPNG